MQIYTTRVKWRSQGTRRTTTKVGIPRRLSCHRFPSTLAMHGEPSRRTKQPGPKVSCFAMPGATCEGVGICNKTGHNNRYLAMIVHGLRSHNLDLALGTNDINRYVGRALRKRTRSRASRGEGKQNTPLLQRLLVPSSQHCYVHKAVFEAPSKPGASRGNGRQSVSAAPFRTAGRSIKC